MRVREDTLPWYKQFWPWFLISIPAGTVIAAMITIRLAIVTSDGLVEDDYYKQGLAVNLDMAKDRLASELGISATLSLVDSGTSAIFTGEAASLPFISLKLIHPVAKGHDQEILLANDGSGRFISQQGVSKPDVSWKVLISPPDNNWRLTGRWKPASQKSLVISSE